MTLPEFLRAFPLRAQNLMWLLGAGASAASGIPTAYDMIWDFKRRLYCAEQRVSLQSCDDLTDPK
jgi:NAD-dependent protein deacetylases, SIR2 family